MTTSAIDPDVFRGDIHGFVLYPSSWAKSPGEKFRTVREITENQYRKHVHGGPVQFAMPQQLGGSIFASPNDKPDPMKHLQAATKLFGHEQHDFATAADQSARRYLGLNGDHDHYTHLHGIGSWENNVEPSMMTVFHKPVTGMQLQKVGADVGTWARQHGILVFSPHQGGVEQLLHMRVPSHHPMQPLTPTSVAEISHRITGLFNNYYDQGGDGNKSFWMPGRTILPDETGHSDVLVWVPPWETNPGRIHNAFNEIADHLGVRQPPQFWPGTGTLLGGTSPYSDDEANQMSDAQKRDAAIANYQRALAATEAMVRDPQPTSPMRFGRSPATSGSVIRGVYYPPGKITPNIVTPESTQGQAPLPAYPSVDHLKHHPRMVAFKQRVMAAYNRRNKALKG